MDTETFENILNLALPTLVTILTPLVLLLANSLAKKLGRKLDTETASAVQDMVNNIVAQGAAYAEQYAKNQQKIVQDKIESDHKLEVATIFVLRELEKNNLPTLTADQIASKVESYLGIGTLNKNYMQGDDNDTEYDAVTE